MYYLLDTGVLLGYVRGADYAAHIDRTYHPADLPNIAVASIVSVAELRSMATCRSWGERKMLVLGEVLGRIPALDINHPDIIARFAEIDAYRQGRLPGRPLPAGMSARSMGDNDIWIAATASVLRATLLTTDQDFPFLNGVFLPVEYVEPCGKG